MPSTGASSISACRTHLHSLSNSNHTVAATPMKWQPVAARAGYSGGSPCRLLGWHFCLHLDSIIKTKIVRNPQSELASRPVLCFPCFDKVDTEKKNGRKTERKREQSGSQNERHSRRVKRAATKSIPLDISNLKHPSLWLPSSLLLHPSLWLLLSSLSFQPLFYSSLLFQPCRNKGSATLTFKPVLTGDFRHS